MPPKVQNRPPGQGKSRSARRRRARAAKRAGKTSAAPASRANVMLGPLRPVGTSKDADYCRAYANVLDDPFHHEPVRLGFGTLVDTSIGVARVTLTAAANASDGTMTVVIKPNAHYPFSWNSAGSSTNPVTGSSWSSPADSSFAAATAQFDSARPIALGVRVTPISAATDKIARIVCSQINYDATTNNALLNALNATTAQDWFLTHLGSKVTVGAGSSTPAEMTWRPMSLRNFEFSQDFFENLPNVSATEVFPQVGPVLVLSIAGPNSLQYDVEVIYYYEAVANVGAISTGQTDKSEKASDYFPSLEKFYSRVSSLLTDENVGHLANMATAAPAIWKRYQQATIPYRPSLKLQVAESELESKDVGPSSEVRRRGSVDRTFGIALGRRDHGRF